MFFFHLFCYRKKENFCSFSTLLFLSGSSFDMLLTNKLGIRTYWIKKPYTSNIIKANTLNPDHKLDHLKITMAANKKLVNLYIKHAFPINIFQIALALNLFLITNIIVHTRFKNSQTQYFRINMLLLFHAPPIFEL